MVSINGEQCMSNDNSVLVVSSEDNKIAWKAIKLLKTNLFGIRIGSVHCLIDKEIVKEWIKKTKKEKAIYDP